jgi:Cu2+-exporting ATPase
LVRDGVDPAALQQAATLAVHSRHPLARALVAASLTAPPADHVEEYPGLGITGSGMRLGSAAFVGAVSSGSCSGPELWLSRTGEAPVRFRFAERPRRDAAETIARLRAMGLQVRLLSGDNAASVSTIAAAVGIDDWRAECSPIDKVALLRRMGGRVLMVGDGLNDGPCLAEAHVSVSPATAADISQTLADAVFQSTGLQAVAELVVTARRARGLMRGNIALSLAYNLVMVPLAVVGLVTPWLAAVAMSSSSLLVIGNSFRARA